MIKLDLNKISGLELPELDIVQAVPVQINLGEIKGRLRTMTFEIPSVNQYFDFEARYVRILASHFITLSQIRFLEYGDFENMGLKQEFINQLIKAMQARTFKKDFIMILDKYFKADFNIKKICDLIQPQQLCYLFLFIHKIIETVKKKFLLTLDRINSQILATFSISLKESSAKIEPRF